MSQPCGFLRNARRASPAATPVTSQADPSPLENKDCSACNVCNGFLAKGVRDQRRLPVSARLKQRNSTRVRVAKKSGS